MCLLEALYLCITGGRSKERLGKVCNILQWSFLQHSSARSEKKVGTGESNNLEEHCKSVHAGDSSVRVQDAKQLECEKWKAVCVVLRRKCPLYFLCVYF